jgi:dolichol-phosphate mannosyltransferase
MPEKNRIVLVPTYNEARSIGPLVDGIVRAVPGAHILVVDDSSPDGTAAVVREMQASRPWLHLLVRPRKEGLGVAYGDGFRWALARGYEEFAQMDADFSHQPGTLPTLFAALERADVAVGSRYIPGGVIESWELWRRWLSRGGNYYARTVLGIHAQDLTSGFRAYRRGVLESIVDSPFMSNGYAFQIEVLARVARAGYTFVEVPIVFTERVRGETKIHAGIIWEAFWNVLTLRGKRTVK